MKNKAKLSTLTIALFAIALTGCESEVYPPDGPVRYPEDNITNITLDRHYASLFYNDKVGSTFNEEIQLAPVVYPKQSQKRRLIWTSSNPQVATVDSHGLVKAVGEGTSEITVSNTDGTISTSSHIIVNNMNDQKIAFCNNRLDDIVARQNKSTFEMPDTISCYETYNQVITKNGKQVSRTYFTQTITTSKDKAILKLDINEIEWKCEDGSPVESSFQYFFHTTDQYESFLYKSSGMVKNYMSVNQSDFIGKGKLEALKAICDNFFTSGSKIIEENYTDILCQEAKNNKWLTSTDKNEHYGRMSDTVGQLAFDLREQINYSSSFSQDEKDMHIPTGTPYTLDVYDRVVFENFLVTGKYIEQSATYSIDGDNYVNAVTVDCFYKTGEEIEMPNKDSYSKADSIFNL